MSSTKAEPAPFTAFNLLLWGWIVATRVVPPTSVEACVAEYAANISRLKVAHSKATDGLERSNRDCQNQSVELQKKVDKATSTCDREKADLSTKFDYAKTFAAIVERKCDADLKASQALPTAIAVGDRSRADLSGILIAYDAFKLSPQSQADDNVVVNAISLLFGLDKAAHSASPVDHIARIRGYMYQYGKAAEPSAHFLAIYLPHADRSPESIKALFDNSKSALYAFVGKDLYERSQMQFFVHAFRNSHQMMSQTLVNEEALKLLMLSKDDVDPKKLGATCALSQIENIAKHTKGMSNAFSIKYAKEIATVEDWFCAFWIRRTREGNAAGLLAILTEIAEHYGDIVPANK